MITVENLSVRAGTFELKGLTMSVATSQYAVLMGKTGAGKTTILETLCGLKPAGSGTIRLNDRDVTRLKPAERGIGYVPQDRALFTTMTVRENLAFALAIRKTNRADIDQRVNELADWLSLQQLLERTPDDLSGGEAQRVALGRALASKPAILCLDEPLSALDDETREEMYAVLRSVRERTGVTVLQVTHHLSDATRLADKILRLENGRLVENGLPDLRDCQTT